MEDELLVALDLEDFLQQQGCVVLNPVGTIESAMEAIGRSRPDAALLDLNLGGQSTSPVAEQLSSKSIPFIVVTGYVQTALKEPAIGHAPVIPKPWNGTELIRELAHLLVPEGG